ncbi:9845_t:CDS:2 [Funneliformis mosseae]|uniref:9845_t:CDS:1 n=1 Tax=Funneliformis mosseae TaxID=27381 RepID=A0A9N9GB30_FUNMO|nr:9845_t:CDS:2 [Funneliformis mosseae]
MENNYNSDLEMEEIGFFYRKRHSETIEISIELGHDIRVRKWY